MILNNFVSKLPQINIGIFQIQKQDKSILHFQALFVGIV
jgi:hypothetical protein